MRQQKSPRVASAGRRTPLDLESRFRDWGRMPSRLLVLAVLIASISGMLLIALPQSWPDSEASAPVRGAAAPAPVAGKPADIDIAKTDLKLYRRIIERVRAGEGYYHAATAMQRYNHYPVRPFFTVRFPTLAWLHAHVLPPGSAAVLLLLICAIAILGWGGALGEGLSLQWAVISAGLVGIGSIIFANEELSVFHEMPAGLLVAAGLGLWRPGRYVWSVALVLAAMLIRETSAGVAVVMMVCALWERRRAEALVWLASLGILMGCVALHAAAVSGMTLAGDPYSQGWNGWGGWAFLVRMMIRTSVLGLLPLGTGVPFLLLALLGWAGWRTRIGTRVALILGGYSAVFMTAARPDNFYWVVLISPLIPLGLLFAPRAWLDLWHAARGPGMQGSTQRLGEVVLPMAGQGEGYAVNRHHVDPSSRVIHRA